MTLRTWLHKPLLGAAMLLLTLSASIQAAEKADAAKKEMAGEIPAEKAEDFCGICEAKTNVHKALPWLDVGADLRLREIYGNNLTTLDKGNTTDEFHFQRYRVRTWFKMRVLQAMGYEGKEAKDLTLNFRMVYEPRTVQRPKATENFIRNEIIIDKLNLQWANAFGMPLTVTVGRQDIKLDDGWLVFEGTPSDGSRTVYFDAARLTWVAKEIDTKFDVIYINQKTDSAWWLKPINDQQVPVNFNVDSVGAILYVTNTSLPKTQISGYFIYKHDNLENSTQTNDIYTFGGRIAGNVCTRWDYRAELAYQFGKRDSSAINAMGFNSRLTYSFKDECDNKVYIGYEYRSGDRARTGTDEGFDILWGAYPQWSNIYNGYADRLDGRGPAQSPNIHRIGLGWNLKPCKKMALLFDYHLLFADQRPASGDPNFSSDAAFRGQLVSALMKYTFNEHISGHLIGEVFFPGDYYRNNHNDPAVFTRAELSFKW